MKIIPMSLFTLAFSGYVYMQAVDTAMTTLKHMNFMMNSAVTEMNTAGTPTATVVNEVPPAAF